MSPKPAKKIKITPISPADLPEIPLSTPAKGFAKTFAAFQNPNYRLFFMGQTLSLIGTWARSAAWGWLAYQWTHSKLLLGLTFLFLFSTYAGSLADRIPKLAIFKITSWTAMAASLVFSFLLFHGERDITILMGFVSLWGLCMAFEMPARQSLMVELVGKEHLVNAIALNSAMVNATRVLGPALGGILLSNYGPQWCFLLDALSFTAVLAGLYLMRIDKTTHIKEAKTDWKYYSEGFRYVKNHPTLARTMGLMLLLSIGGWAYLSQFPAFVQDRLGLQADGYGWLLAMNGLGACTAALWVASQGRQLIKERTLFFGIAVYSLFIFLFGFQHNPVGAAFLVYFAGFGIVLFFSTGNSVIQTYSPDPLRGRIMGIWALVFGGGMPIGSFWMGYLAAHTDSGVALQAGGVFCALGAFLIYFFGLKRHRF
jgi:predicted MFS family arabinose efflux permease